MDWILVLLIGIQAIVDVGRELDWSKIEDSIRLDPKIQTTFFLFHFAVFLLLFGKFHLMLTGIPTMGLIGLYLLMLSDFMHVYPYIVCTPTMMHLCSHALRPKLTISKDQILSAKKFNHVILLTFQSEEKVMHQLQIDTRAFKDFKPFEEWLGHFLQHMEQKKEAA